MEANSIAVNIKGLGDFNIQKGITLKELAEIHFKEAALKPLAAFVNNILKELNHSIVEAGSIEFIDIGSDDGMLIYNRSLSFLLLKALLDLFPDNSVLIRHSVGSGLYITFKDSAIITKEDSQKIKEHMRELIGYKLPFERVKLSNKEAKRLLTLNKRTDKLESRKHTGNNHVDLYRLGGYYDFLGGQLVPDTGYLELFDLISKPPGLLLISPDRDIPNTIGAYVEQNKLFNIFTEYKQWENILGINSISDLNSLIKIDGGGDFIRVNEALHEKKIANIADEIKNKIASRRIVLISGPSSSGKTTFAKRLAIQLRVNGLIPHIISLDDYYLNRERTPLDENGNYDFESIYALDISLINKHLGEIEKGNEVDVPIYSFLENKRLEKGRKIKLEPNGVLIIEGIHGLNELLTPDITREHKYKIYVSALTSLNIDDHIRISTTDVRKIRRIVRDFKFRGTDALKTLKMFPSVRRGERKNIFPYQEEADVMFNSSLVYELCVLKRLAHPLLSHIIADTPEYNEARRLMKFLEHFLPIKTCDIPTVSILREFIGGSCFK